MTVRKYIFAAHSARQPILAVLLDPDKPAACRALLPYISTADITLVGGSTGACQTDLIDSIRACTTRPVVLFPGNVAQFSPKADALLFLSVLTARTPDILIEPHIQAALPIRNAAIETIPMGYILVDGGRKSSVEVATHSTPLSQQDLSSIVSTAVAGELLGKDLIYIEAGSGAYTPVSTAVITAVRSHITLPLIVGGGICHTAQMTDAFAAGADIVVIGNHFEHHPEQLPIFIKAKTDYANHRN